VAEPTALAGPLLVLGSGNWAMETAEHIRRRAPSATLLELSDGADGTFAAGLSRARLGVLLHVRHDATAPDEADALTTIRARFEARSLPYFDIERDGARIWLGPSVVPGLVGCRRCWEARRLQHADWLGLPPAASAQGPSPRLTAAAAVAVARRLLRSPAAEAGVVRRLLPAAATPSIGRVIPVCGCRRCAPPGQPAVGWSLARAHTTLVPTPA
jgi:hypothetical protein